MEAIPGTREVNGLVELKEDVSSSPIYNADLAPTPIDKRTWGTWHIASLWIGMVICVPTYMLAAGLMQSGMTWWQAEITILLGNAIVLVPMMLNAHAGTKYGVPLPLLLRSSFGYRGTHVPSIMRGLVACGWFGIQTWIGGQALFALAGVLVPGLDGPAKLPFLGINPWELLCFLLFWAMNIYFIVAGMESIKWMETLAAPLLIAMGLALLGWGVVKGGGFQRVLDAGSGFVNPTLTAMRSHAILGPDFAGRKIEQIVLRGNMLKVDGARRVVAVRFAGTSADLQREGWRTDLSPLEIGYAYFFHDPERVWTNAYAEFRDASGNTTTLVVPVEVGETEDIPFWSLFFPALTAMVGFWATVALNIPDFMRFAKSQRAQFMGQMIGLPPTMVLFSFIGIFVTCAAVVVFPDILIKEQAPWDPVQLLKRKEFASPVIVFLSTVFLLVATLSTNIAANVVAPANAITNLFPKTVSFKAAGVITGIIGIVMMPWKLLATAGAYLFTWLIGYSALLGPIGGIMIADYFLIRRQRLNLPHLYKTDGEYAYTNGIHWKAIIILIASILPNVPGFLAAAGALPGTSIPAIFLDIYPYAWFTGFGLAFSLYAILARPRVSA